MERMLLLRGLGTGGRQNELIEMALTHLFDSMEIDMADLLGRLDAMGKSFALQFLASAKTRVGTFRLPIDFGAADDVYAKQAAKVDSILELARALNASRCYVEVEAGNDLRPFQENFDKQTQRIKEISQKLEAAGIRVGLKMEPVSSRKTRAFKFIERAEQLLTMIRMCGTANVGLSLDSGEWMVTGGAMDQIADLTAAKIVDVRFSDAELGPASALLHCLPGELSDSIAAAVARHLRSVGWSGPIAITGHSSLFQSNDRHSVVRKMQLVLNQISEILEGTREDLTLPAPVVEELAPASSDAPAQTSIGKGVEAQTAV